MAIKQVILDDIDVTKDTLFGDSFSVEISRDTTTRTAVFALTSDLILKGEAYNLIESKFIPNCFSCSQTLEMTIIPDCCGVALSFELIAEGVVFDLVNCQARITGLQTTGATRALKYLDSHVWWRDSDGFNVMDFYFFPRIMYFKEPSWWQRLTMIFRNFGNSRYHFYHQAPFVNDVLEWNAGRAGLLFESESIFLAYEEYRRMAILYAANREGPNVNNYIPIIEENLPIETPLQLMQRLNPVFNADYRIIGDKLRFETIGYWEDNALEIDDYDDIINRNAVVESSDISLNTDRNKAYGRYEYGNDGVDSASNRMHFYYSDFIEWNPSGANECLRGELTNIIDFGSTHIIGDVAYWRLRDDEDLDVMDRVASRNSDAKLYMTTGQCQLPKLLIMPETWRTDQSPLKHTPWYRLNTATDVRETGWQLSFRENEPEGLYQRFHKRTDPLRTTEIEMGDLNFVPINFCEIVTRVADQGLEIALTTIWGKAIPSSVVLNFSNQTITMRELTVRCEL